MKFYELFKVADLKTRYKIYQEVEKNEIGLLIDCTGYEVSDKLPFSTLLKEVVYMTYIKDDKGVALNVLITK